MHKCPEPRKTRQTRLQRKEEGQRDPGDANYLSECLAGASPCSVSWLMLLRAVGHRSGFMRSRHQHTRLTTLSPTCHAPPPPPPGDIVVPKGFWQGLRCWSKRKRKRWACTFWEVSGRLHHYAEFIQKLANKCCSPALVFPQICTFNSPACVHLHSSWPHKLF